LLRFAVNHMTVANASYQVLLDTASETGCCGIEVRNDLSGSLFDGVDPVIAGEMARDKGVRILTIAEVTAFNHFSNEVMGNVEALVSVAKACDAEGISLIPANDGSGLDCDSRYHDLKQALTEIKPVLESNNLVGFVEPLGFDSASLRHKRELADVITELDAADRFKIIHDTFHHFLATAPDNSSPESSARAEIAERVMNADGFFAEHTGIVHISGVTDQRISAQDMTDSHRVLVDAADQLYNLEQINALVGAGYAGPISVEAFSPVVHEYADAASRLTQSFNYIDTEINISNSPIGRSGIR